MFKNLIIITVLALLVSTASNLSLINAQKACPRSGKIKNTNNHADFYRTVNEWLAIETLEKLYDTEIEYLLEYGIGDFATPDNLNNAGVIDSNLDTDEN